jgi:type II secretory pathway component HofQ
MTCGFLLALVQATARSSEARPTPRPETSAERTRKALEQTVTFDLLHHPLSEVVRLLRDQSGVRLALDRQGLSQIGINPDEVIVTTKLSMTLGSSLRQILSQHNMDYAIIGEMVLITTEELAVRRQMRQPVSIRFDRLQLIAALDQLARETATNLVLDRLAIQYANTPVTLNLDDVPLEVIVKLLAYQAGLKQIRVGNVMMVTTKANASELREDSEFGPVLPTRPNSVILVDYD